ncbi:MAG: polyprenyl synthetase family protein [Actinomycetaceae bacterium]|nr:polyprenyl synthetase family protein [Actinomycetaceae bacterium]
MSITNSQASPAIDLPSFAPQMQNRCRSFLERELARHRGHSALSAFAQIVTPYVTEGKTLRALGVSVGAAVASGAELGTDQIALDLGLALELYQGSALIHDDFIDQAPMRRGQPSAHVRATTLLPHSAAVPTAILAGDYLLSLTHLATSEALAHCDRSVQYRVGRYLADITAEVAWGQYLDVLTGTADLGDPRSLQQHVMEVIAVKAGNYSVMRPLLLGALIHTGREEVLAPLQMAGHNWGLAFQLRDDALDFAKASKATGKRRGTDMREGKRTVLLALTLQHADPYDRMEILQALGNPQLTDSDIESIYQIMLRSGAWEEHEALISKLSKQGQEALTGSPLSDSALNLLQDYAKLLLEREY